MGNGYVGGYFSIFHAGNFLPFHIPFYTKFSSIFHSILPHQGKFKPGTKRNLYSIFATLNVPLQVVALEGKQYGTMHLIPYFKDYRNELP